MQRNSIPSLAADYDAVPPTPPRRRLARLALVASMVTVVVLGTASGAGAATWTNYSRPGTVTLVTSQAVSDWQSASHQLVQPARTVTRSSATTGAQWVSIQYRFWVGSGCGNAGNCTSWRVANSQTTWTQIAAGRSSAAIKGAYISVVAGNSWYTDSIVTWFQANGNTTGPQLGQTWVKHSSQADYSCEGTGLWCITFPNRVVGADISIF